MAGGAHLADGLRRLVTDPQNGWLCPLSEVVHHTGQIVLLRRLQGSWEPLQWLPPGG